MAKVRNILTFCTILFLTVEGSNDVKEQKIIGQFRSLFESYASIPTDGTFSERNLDVHPHLLDLQKDLTELRGNTVRTFAPMETEDYESHKLNHILLRFNVTRIPSKESLRFAELRISHSSLPSVESTTEGDVPKNRQLIKAFCRGRLIGSKIIDANVNGTISFDLSRTIRTWLKSPHDTNNITVVVLPVAKKENVMPVRLRRSAEDSQHPLLVLHTDDESMASVNHNAKNISKTTTRESRRCQKHSFYVDFQKLGWEKWIIAPSGFESSYCQGLCRFPLPRFLNSTNHASLQSLLHSRHPSKVPSPCCVPDSFLPLSMVFLDENNEHVLKHFKDMIVESCTCR